MEVLDWCFLEESLERHSLLVKLVDICLKTCCVKANINTDLSMGITKKCNNFSIFSIFALVEKNICKHLLIIVWPSQNLCGQK